MYQSTPVTQVNLSTTDGDMGILANHVASIAQLKPGLVEIFESNTKKTFFGNDSKYKIIYLISFGWICYYES